MHDPVGGGGEFVERDVLRSECGEHRVKRVCMCVGCQVLAIGAKLEFAGAADICDRSVQDRRQPEIENLDLER